MRGLTKKMMLASAAGVAIVAGSAGAASAHGGHGHGDVDLVDVDLDENAVHVEDNPVLNNLAQDGLLEDVDAAVFGDNQPR